jgi:ankyrin repeat protein
MTLSILIKATAILVLGMGATVLARRARAATRHVILVCTFAAMAALPIAAAWMPPVRVALPIAVGSGSERAAQAPANPSGLAPAHAPMTGLDATLLRLGFKKHSVPVEILRRIWRELGWSSVWGAGTLGMAGWLGFGLLRLRRIRREGVPFLRLGDRAQAVAVAGGVRTFVDIIQHERIAAPITCGVRRPAIILPADVDAWEPRDLDRALVHELEHVRRADWFVQMFARLVCAVYWFHPLAWFALRRLCLEAERACDDAVVKTSAGTDYAEQLVLLAKRLSAGAAPLTLGMARRSDLSSRVSALLDRRQRRGRTGVASIAGIAAAAALVVLTLAPVRTVAAPPNAENGGGQTPVLSQRGSSADHALYRASERGDLERMAQLIDRGANVNARIDGDGSPLIGAARAGRLEAVRLLLDRGADPNMPVEGDGNPLIMAARDGHLAVVTLLLDRGAQIDMVVPSDENALIQASEKGELEVVKLLVSRGANVNARVFVAFGDGRSGEWRTPLSQARRERHDVVAAYLQSVGAR